MSGFSEVQAISTTLPDVLLLEPTVFSDARGCFFESFNARRFAEHCGVAEIFVQDNHSVSRRGVLRGLHYQVRQPQGKLVRVVNGEIFDVAVDLRHSSPTFGKWQGFRLSAENRQQLWIPPGFAHGFLALSASAEVLYKTTDYWAPELERCIRWDTPDLAIEWPIRTAPEVSAKDADGLPFTAAEKFP